MTMPPVASRLQDRAKASTSARCVGVQAAAAVADEQLDRVVLLLDGDRMPQPVVGRRIRRTVAAAGACGSPRAAMAQPANSAALKNVTAIRRRAAVAAWSRIIELSSSRRQSRMKP